MNTTPAAMMSQSQTLKPSSTPSATVRAMIKVKAATVPQLLTRECGLATSSFPSVDPIGGFYNPPSGGAQEREAGYRDHRRLRTAASRRDAGGRLSGGAMASEGEAPHDETTTKSSPARVT